MRGMRFGKKWMIGGVVLLMAGGPALAGTLTLSGTVRDFKRGDWRGGHPDFETANTVRGHGDYGLVPGLVTMHLGADHTPVYNPDRPGNDTIASAQSFASWYHDTSGVNVSVPFSITLSNGQKGDGGVYSYDNPAFFPIDGRGLGNQDQRDSHGRVHNFSFTFAMHNKFTYSPGQKFTFIGDDDVWVYINGEKVVDLGGVHSAETGSVLLFNGKAFVSNQDFPVGGDVKAVDWRMANEMSQDWQILGMPGRCPINRGDHYVDLDLTNGHADIRADFSEDSVTVRTTSTLKSAVVEFTDGSTQQFLNLTVGHAGTFAGTGAYVGKKVAGVSVKTADATANQPYVHLTPTGASGDAATLDFFFAERHTTESHFRIDTSMNLQPQPLDTVSALYD